MPDANKVGQYRKGILYERFSGRPEKRGIKRKETKVEIWPKSYFIYCIQSNLYHSLYRVRVFGSMWRLERWSARALFSYPHVTILLLHVCSYHPLLLTILNLRTFLYYNIQQYKNKSINQIKLSKITKFICFKFKPISI